MPDSVKYLYDLPDDIQDISIGGYGLPVRYNYGVARLEASRQAGNDSISNIINNPLLRGKSISDISENCFYDGEYELEIAREDYIYG